MTIRTRKIGKLGGAAEPLEFVPDQPTREMTVELPDGEWAVDIGFGIPAQGSSGGKITINETQVGAVRESSSVFDGQNVHVVARHQHGALTIRSSSTNVPIHTVTAFPDPTT